MIQDIIQKTLRVPIEKNVAPGDGSAITRQLDIALMEVGFKLSTNLFATLAGQEPLAVLALAKDILETVRALVGDHVKHNTYFIDFPNGVPDTTEFWCREVYRLLTTGTTRYGRYQHSYEDMLARQDEFITSAKDRVTVLQLGGTLAEETQALYLSLAEGTVPLGDTDHKLIERLAVVCQEGKQPEEIPVRETRAIINAVRTRTGQPVLANTITDILRLAYALSDADVTLQQNAQFTRFSRPLRRALMSKLNAIVSHSPAQLADVRQYKERWKRLGERLHPHEYPHFPGAQDVFAVARGDKRVSSLEGKIEVALRNREFEQALTLLAKKPGLLFRSLDHLLRETSPAQHELVLAALKGAAPNTSARVLLSLREHLQNRATAGKQRVFVNRKRRAWVAADERESLDQGHLEPFFQVLDQQIVNRLAETTHLVVDPAVLGVALPLSEKSKDSGFAIMPRGSIQKVDTTDTLRFFVYWKQAEQKTDYDLSAIILDENFRLVEQVSYTSLRALGAVHSGDITSAPNGASEFIDIDLRKVGGKYLLPQVNIYSGEDFTRVEECFFGFMERAYDQGGAPFEPRTVRVKSDLRGEGRIALPMVFARSEDGTWTAKWLHLYLKGYPNFNAVENNRLTTSLLGRSIAERAYLDMEYLVDLMQKKAQAFSWYTGQALNTEEEVTFIGLQAPDNLPADATVYALGNLQNLIPK